MTDKDQDSSSQEHRKKSKEAFGGYMTSPCSHFICKLSAKRASCKSKKKKDRKKIVVN